MPAAQAGHWGCVHAVLPPQRLLLRARELAKLLPNGAPLALQALQRTVPGIYNLPIRGALAVAKPEHKDFSTYQKMLLSEDFMEGARAFAERRPPKMAGALKPASRMMVFIGLLRGGQPGPFPGQPCSEFID